MTRKILTLLLMTVLFITVFVSCDKEETKSNITNIQLDTDKTTMMPGETVTLVATVSPADASDFAWYSSDNSVATVKDGVVTAVADGNVTIICASGNGVYDECVIIVDSGSCAHDINWIITEATCTSAGEKHGECKKCHLSLGYEVIAMLPHTPGEIKISNEKEPTCAEEGSYDKTAYCVVCKRIAIKETVKVEKLEHSFGEWNETVAATCTTEGKKIRECEACGYKHEMAIASFGHTTISMPAKEPTCSSDGWKAYEFCTKCDYTTIERIKGTSHKYTIEFIMGAPTQTSSAKGMLACSEKSCEYTTGELVTYPALSNPSYKVETLSDGQKRYTITVKNEKGELVEASFII